MLLGDIWRIEYPDLLVVSPDVGGVVRARALAKHLGRTWRSSTSAGRAPNEAKVMHIIGEVKGRPCVLMDDMVDTAGTLCEAAAALKSHGAKSVVAYCTHAVLSGAAIPAHRPVAARRTGGDGHHPDCARGRGRKRIPLV